LTNIHDCPFDDDKISPEFEMARNNEGEWEFSLKPGKELTLARGPLPWRD
jgi:hypothetical protein